MFIKPTKDLIAILSLSLLIPLVSSSFATNISNTKSIYGSSLTNIGVRGTAYFDNGTGEFTSHGGYSKLVAKDTLTYKTYVNRTGQSHSKYRAVQTYELSSYNIVIRVSRFETVKLRIPSPGSMR